MMAEGTAGVLIDMVRNQCLIRGFEGIKGLGLAFRNLDIDLSKRIVYEELRDGLKGYGIVISEENLQTLFNTLDKDGSGEIDFQEFLKSLSPPMNERRKEVVNLAFNALDTNEDGVLRYQDLAKGIETLPTTTTNKKSSDMYQSWKKGLTAKGVLLISKIRQACLDKGFTGMKALEKLCRTFREMDVDFSKRLSEKEFKDGIRNYFDNVHFSDEEIAVLFLSFDSDENKMIDFNEFLQRLKPDPPGCRKAVINEVFDYLDVTKDGYLNIEDLRVRCRDKILCHTKYLTGEWSEEEAYKNFLRAFDNQDCPDEIVTREEFMDYYSGVSASVSDDQFFDLSMRQLYNLPPSRSSSSALKGGN